MMEKPYGRIKVQENEDGRLRLGGGCETCPVEACATVTYRGSACASQRALHGLGDPMTNSDHIRAMSDEELAASPIIGRTICNLIYDRGESEKYCLKDEPCSSCIRNWLKAPYKENEDGDK